MTIAQYDLTYECGFDGELGNMASIDAIGHLGHLDVELFLADVADELENAGYDECPTFGLEVEHLWRSEHPFQLDTEDGLDEEGTAPWTYHYTTEEREDAVAVTRFQIASPWAREAVSPRAERAVRDRRTGEHTIEGVDSWPLMCIHHPDRPATVAIPEERFSDPGDDVLDGNIHYCSPCMLAFEKRVKIATERAWAPERTAEFLAVFTDDTVALAFEHPLLRADLDAALNGRDGDGSARRRLRAFEDAYRATGRKEHRSIATAMPGYKSLMLSDIHWLVEDYAHRSA